VDRISIGLLVLALAPAAWIVGSLATDGGYLLPLGVMLIGLGLAAWAFPADRPVLAGLGFALAAVGVALFYDFDLFDGLPSRAGAVVALGLAVAAVSTWAGAPRGASVGLAVVAVGSALWVYSDGRPWESLADQPLEWQVGNLLAVGGAFTASLHTWSKG
jgi:hypothetical protein